MVHLHAGLLLADGALCALPGVGGAVEQVPGGDAAVVDQQLPLLVCGPAQQRYRVGYPVPYCVTLHDHVLGKLSVSELPTECKFVLRVAEGDFVHPEEPPDCGREPGELRVQVLEAADVPGRGLLRADGEHLPVRLRGVQEPEDAEYLDLHNLAAVEGPGANLEIVQYYS